MSLFTFSYVLPRFIEPQNISRQLLLQVADHAKGWNTMNGNTGACDC